MHPGYPITVGRYEILKPLAEGGFGQVYLARMGGAAGFNRLVAIKRIKREHTASTEFVRDFIREARIGGFMQHHNVVQVLGFDEIEGNYLLVMEFVEGIGLESVIHLHFLDQKPLPLPVVAELVGQAAEGLQYIHTLSEPGGQPLRLVHRDIKPSNLLISRSGMVKITDFGIARAAIEGGKQTAAGLIKGTLNYLSPEQARGEHLDFRSDLYSLGSILFEMLVLERLWADDSPYLLLGKLGNNALEDRLSAVPEPGRVFLPILNRLLTRDPVDRFQSAGEVAEQCRLLQLQLAVPGQTLGRIAPAWIDEVAVRKGEYDVESSPTRHVGEEFLHRKDPFEQIAEQRLDSNRRLAPTAPYGQDVPPEVAIVNAQQAPAPTAIHTLATPEQLATTVAAAVKIALEDLEKTRAASTPSNPTSVRPNVASSPGVSAQSPGTESGAASTPSSASAASASALMAASADPSREPPSQDLEGAAVTTPAPRHSSQFMQLLGGGAALLGSVVVAIWLLRTPQEVVIQDAPQGDAGSPTSRPSSPEQPTAAPATPVGVAAVQGTPATAVTALATPVASPNRPGAGSREGQKGGKGHTLSSGSGAGEGTTGSAATPARLPSEGPAPTPRPPAPVTPRPPPPVEREVKAEEVKPVDAKTAAVAPGILTVTSRPSAPLSVNGKSYKDTPVKNLQLPPGTYKIELNRPDLNFMKTAEVTLRAGQLTIVACNELGCSVKD